MSLLDILWPRNCELCARACDRPGRHLCSSCLMRLPTVNQTGCCRQCGRSVEGLEGEYLCEDCQKNRPQYDRAASALRFEGDARQMMLDFKFNRHLWLREDLVDFLEAAVCARFSINDIDLVVPVPTTLFHRLDRGYNQSAYFAESLAKRLNRRFDNRLLLRCGHPARQGGLDENARRENARGTFEVRHAERVRGRTVLVVDDVMTTGATLSEASARLKGAGAERVWCVSLARSIRD